MTSFPSSRVWKWWSAFFDDNAQLAVLAAVAMSAAIIGLIVRGFQQDTWGWTEFYSDGFYYLAFAKYAAQGDFFTYANIGPTSGIHPLHWLHLTAVHALTGGNHSWMFPILFLTYAVGFAATVWAMLYTLRMLGAGAKLLLLVIIAMTYGNYLADALDLPILIPVILTNFTNLMESWLLITSLALLIAAGVRQLRTPTRNSWVLVVLVSIMSIWARIDYIFVVLPFVTIVAWRSRDLLRWQKIAIISAPVAALGAWMVLLLIATGIPMTTSSSVKNSLSPALEAGPSGAFDLFTKNFLNSADEPHILIAFAGLLVSGGLLIWALRLRDAGRNPVTQAFLAMLSGMFLLLIYHMVITFHNDIGGWYFRPYRVLVLIVGAFAFSTVFKTDLWSLNRTLRGATGVIAIGAVVLVVGAQLNGPGAASDSLARAHLVREVVQQLEGVVDPNTTFYDGTDGAFGWYGDFTAYHLKGMANTPDYVDIARSTRLLDSAEMIPVYESYINENEIDYYVSYGKGTVSDLFDPCWTTQTMVAYAEKTLGDEYVNSYVLRSEDWVALLECRANGG